MLQSLLSQGSANIARATWLLLFVLSEALIFLQRYSWSAGAKLAPIDPSIGGCSARFSESASAADKIACVSHCAAVRRKQFKPASNTHCRVNTHPSDRGDDGCHHVHCHIRGPRLRRGPGLERADVRPRSAGHCGNLDRQQQKWQWEIRLFMLVKISFYGFEVLLESRHLCPEGFIPIWEELEFCLKKFTTASTTMPIAGLVTTRGHLLDNSQVWQLFTLLDFTVTKLQNNLNILVKNDVKKNESVQNGKKFNYKTHN